jgi:biopolymer transport protein ExbD
VLDDLLQIDLPAGSANPGLGTDNPMAIVYVNLFGQYYYENRLVGEQDLKGLLRSRVKALAQESRSLTLVVWADKQVDLNAVTRLGQLAVEAGIKDALLAQRPAAAFPVTAHPTP